MDEPTSSLTQVDTENLFRVIERLRARGVSVIYISHFLEECQRVCQRYTVLRDGETVGTGDMAAARVEDIIRLMVGREMKDIYPRTPHELGAPVLELKELAGRVKPRRVNLTLRAGKFSDWPASLAPAARRRRARSSAWMNSRRETCSYVAMALRIRCLPIANRQSLIGNPRGASSPRLLPEVRRTAFTPALACSRKTARKRA